jgi:gamma-glutamyltranspeptidase
VSDAGGGPLVPVPLARGSHGAVVAPHHLATAAGLSVLRSGGSAVDAAIATNAVLGVVMPNACGIGGDAFWLIWDERDRRLHALNGSGRSPAGADAGALRMRGLARLPFHGPLSITVPGAVRSWGDSHARFGRLSPADILGPAIEYANAGFPAWDGFIGSVEATAAICDRELERDARSGFHAVYRPGDRPWRPGELVRLPALGTTLQQLAHDGFATFYDSDLGERQGGFLERVGSAITFDDLRGHASTWGDALRSTYRGTTVVSHPPNSSGMVALEILNILDRFERTGDAEWAHLGIEASKLAFADRDANLTDPEAREIPIAELLGEGHTIELAGRIDPRRAAPAPPSRAPVGGGTIYLATVDGDGNAVSLIESNYAGFGSGVVDPETGIHYQNRGSYFSLDPDHPNVLAPRKRTLHTLLPWMLFREREAAPWIVGGSMGGDAQPQIAAQVISSLVDEAVDVRTAVSRSRWFVEPLEHFAPPVDVRAEPRFARGVLEELEAKGHPMERIAPFDSLVGHCHAIELVDGGPARRGSLAAATDPRSAGLPAVW